MTDMAGAQQHMAGVQQPTWLLYASHVGHVRCVLAMPQQCLRISGFPWLTLCSASLAARGFCVTAQVPHKGAQVGCGSCPYESHGPSREAGAL